MMSPSHVLAKALRGLALPPETFVAAAALAAAVPDGAKEPDTLVHRLYREWVNDLVPLYGRARYRTAAAQPASTFMEWLSGRLAAPYHVTYRACDSARAAYGDAVALLFYEVRWRQEVAWAARMRCSDSDRIAFLAEMWLKAARRDPGGLFKGLVDAYAAEAVFDPAYEDSPHHMLTVDEICDGIGDDCHWRPLWLRFAEHQFGRLANGMPRVKLTALAQQVREVEWAERTARANRTQADRLRRWRPALMVDVLGAASRHGLSSDDLVVAEQRFVAAVEAGEIVLAAQPMPPWQVFLRHLTAGIAPIVSDEEALARIEVVQSLPPSWARALPEDFIRLGASDTAMLMDWFDALVEGRRPPPLDPAVDYALFLVEEGTVG